MSLLHFFFRLVLQAEFQRKVKEIMRHYVRALLLNKKLQVDVKMTLGFTRSPAGST
jgi:hypothetical protein